MTPLSNTICFLLALLFFLCVSVLFIKSERLVGTRIHFREQSGEYALTFTHSVPIVNALSLLLRRL